MSKYHMTLIRTSILCIECDFNLCFVSSINELYVFISLIVIQNVIEFELPSNETLNDIVCKISINLLKHNKHTVNNRMYNYILEYMPQQLHVKLMECPILK